MSDAAALVRRLRSGSRVAQLQALRGLGELAGDSPEARQAAVAAGGVAAIVQLKGLGSSEALQGAAADALFALSQAESPATLAAFVEAGAILTLTSMLQSGGGGSGSGAEVQLSAAGALWNLTVCDGGGAALTAGGAIEPLVALLQASNGRPLSKAVQPAAGALWAIAEAGPDQLATAIIEAGGVPALAALLDRCTAAPAGPEQECALVYACRALGCLARRSCDAQAAAAAASSVPHLVGLFSRDSAEAQLSAAGALRALLSRCPAAQAAFAVAGAAPAVVRLLHSTSQGVQTQAAGVLSNAACGCAASSAAMLAAGAVPPLVQLLRTPGHPAHEWAATAVASLLAMQPAAAIRAVVPDGVNALSHLLENSSSKEVREAANMALQALGFALAKAPLQPTADGSSECAASGADSTASPSGEAPTTPVAQPLAQPPRMCGAPGCGATRGLRRCGGCGTVRYCSVECSRAHWRAHKAECRRMQAQRAAAAEGGGEVPGA